mmetsp:Transcript_35615/g.83288  ORF Transcript_35615/g.83288 Transcript_35615/m.83288 type:complete len:226 (+) Transcript_35615:898-1575(+)
MQFATSDQLCQYVHRLRGFEVLHQMHHEGVIIGGQQRALSGNLCWYFSILLVHSLESIPHLRALVLHETNHSSSTSTNKFHMLQILQSHTSILKLDSMHQLIQHLATNNGSEVVFLDEPQLRLRTCHLYRGSSRLIKEQRPLTEVCIFGQRPHCFGVDGHCHLSCSDDVECSSHLALFDDRSPLSVSLQHKGIHQGVNLLRGQVSEDVNLSYQKQLSGVVHYLRT